MMPKYSFLVFATGMATKTVEAFVLIRMLTGPRNPGSLY